ncbi:MAG: peptide chain release factor N(5)-glutamine methyltransferase, partial [Mycetocola sp.]
MTLRTTTVGTLATAITELLAKAGGANPDVDAELLLGHVLDLGRGEIQAAALT